MTKKEEKTVKDSNSALAQTPGPVLWSLKFEHHEAVRKRWRRIYNLPIRKRSQEVIRDALRPKDVVLDFGAHEAQLGEHLRRWGLDVEYRSLDIDTRIQHDYRSLDEVKEPITCIVCQHVLEHFSLRDGYQLMQQFCQKLEPGGRVILTVPNIYHPTRFWQDTEHLTPYTYTELGALLTLTGFELHSITRIYHDPVLRKFLRRIVLHPLFKLLSLDYAYDIVAIGEKPKT